VAADVLAARRSRQEHAEDDSTEPAPKAPPVIVVATKPTEVISTTGEPKWTPLPSGKLLYVENTETPWLRSLEAQ